MAQKYRCPVCGATHKELQDQCRLCGQALGPEAAVGTPQESRSAVEERKGIGGIVAVAVLLVFAVAVVAVLLGVVPGVKVIDSAKNKAGVNTASDGWSQYAFPAGGYSVQFPDGERKTKVDGETYTAYTLINKDTLLLVSARRVMTPAEYETLTQSTEPVQALKRVINASADAFETSEKATGAKVEKRTETSALGAPAVYWEERDVKPDIGGLRTDTALYSRNIFFIKGGIGYVISVVSVYRDPEQFDRLLSTLQIDAPPGQSTGTTVAAAP